MKSRKLYGRKLTTIIMLLRKQNLNMRSVSEKVVFCGEPFTKETRSCSEGSTGFPDLREVGFVLC